MMNTTHSKEESLRENCAAGFSQEKKDADGFSQEKPQEKKDKLLVHVETWGCQMNVADSENMIGLLKDNYALTSTPESADLIILNTCHIREKARHKVASRLGVLKELKQDRPNLLIAVAGCVAQAEGKKLLEEIPYIDVLLGPGKIQKLPELIEMRKSSGQQTISIGFEKKEAKVQTESLELSCQKSTEPNQIVDGKNEISRFVNIQQGCDNFCTFCVVPFTRGREISDRPEVIQAKVKALVKHGAKEIMLLGQNVNSYGLDLVKDGQLKPSEEGPFVSLLKSVAQIEGLERLRFTTSNPHDFTFPLAQLFSETPKLGKYLHLPVQSGSNSILEAMKRKVTVEEYLERVAWIKSFVPDLALSTDIIVGFPGETDEDFEGTLNLLKTIRYSFVFAFCYSKRKGTAAHRFVEQVPESLKKARLAALNKLQDQITLEENSKDVGGTREVLFTYGSKKEENAYYGRTEQYRLVKVRSQRNILGKMLKVSIVSCNKTTLIGDLA